MTRKRFSEEAALDLLRQIDLDLASGGTDERAIRTAGISEATYYKWRKLFGGMGQVSIAGTSGHGEGERPAEEDRC